MAYVEEGKRKQKEKSNLTHLLTLALALVGVPSTEKEEIKVLYRSLQ